MIRQVLSVASTRVLASVLQGFTLFALAMLLGAAQFGQFVTLLAVGSLSGVVLGMGTSSLALRLLSMENPRSIAGGIALLRYPTASGAAIFTVLIATTALQSDSYLLVGAAVAFSLADSTGEIVESILFGLRNHVRAQYAMLARRAGIAAAVAIGWTTGHVLIWLGATAVLVVGSAPIWLLGEVRKPTSMREVAHAAVPFWGATLLSKVQSADVILASMLVSSTQSGVYAAASRLTSPLNTLTASAMAILTPSMAAIPERSHRTFAFVRMRKYLFAVAAGLILLSPAIGWITELALGPGYEGVAVPASILAASTGVSAITQGYVSYFFASGQPKFVIRARVISTTLAAGLAVPLGLLWGVRGVAVSIVLMQALQVGTLDHEFRRARRASRAPAPDA